MLLVFIVIVLIAAGIAVLLSHSQTGNAGIQREGPSEARFVPKDQATKGTPTGDILVGITDARIQGNPRDPASLYCAISVSAMNAVNRELQSLVLGFDYSAPNADKASGNVTFAGLDPDSLEIRQQHVAKMADCRELTAKVTVVACVIDPGIDCKARVRPIRQGIVRLE